MNAPTHLETEVETRGIKKADLLDLTTQEAQMRDALKAYNQFMADIPSLDSSQYTAACNCLSCGTAVSGPNAFTSGYCDPTSAANPCSPSYVPGPSAAEKSFRMWGTYTCQQMQDLWGVCNNGADPNHQVIMANCPSTCGVAPAACYSSTDVRCDCGTQQAAIPENQQQQEIVQRITEWKARGAAVSQDLESHAKLLQTKLMETVRQSDQDKEIANTNVTGLQSLINNLNVERDKIAAKRDELNTAQGVDSNLKIEYKSQHLQYIVLFLVLLVVVGILLRIQTSQESGAMELVVLVASVLFMIYHFSNWIITAADDLWVWLNGLFNF